MGAVPPAASAAENARRTAAVSSLENTGAGPRLKMEKKEEIPVDNPSETGIINSFDKRIDKARPAKPARARGER